MAPRDPTCWLFSTCLIFLLLPRTSLCLAVVGVNGPPITNITLNEGFRNATHIVAMQVCDHDVSVPFISLSLLSFPPSAFHHSDLHGAASAQAQERNH